MNETKFNGMGNIYAKYRPSYPQEFIEFIYSHVGVNINSVIADIGSGTGILTKQLLEKGNRVFAVEPNSDMRTEAENNLNSFDNYISVNGTAENTNLEDRSIDFITVAQAFHWFNRRAFKTECERILKKDGKVILVWNSRDEKSEIVRKTDDVNRIYCPEFTGFSGGERGAKSEDDFNNFFSGDYITRFFKNDITYDEQSFIGRNLSGSYAPKENEKNYSVYIAELKSLFQKYSKNNSLIMPNVTRVYIGRV